MWASHKLFCPLLKRWRHVLSGKASRASCLAAFEQFLGTFVPAEEGLNDI
jgi:hypothetical protein